MTTLLPPVDSVLHTIGRTPVVRLRRLAGRDVADVYVKLEYFNPTGSYKDRMAVAMIEGAERRGVAGLLRGPIAQLIWMPMLAFEVPGGLWLLIKGVPPLWSPWSRLVRPA